MSTAHKYLCEKLNILHRDISIGNILLYRVDEDQEVTGLLVDFDFSMTIRQGVAADASVGDHMSSDEVIEPAGDKTGRNEDDKSSSSDEPSDKDDESDAEVVDDEDDGDDEAVSDAAGGHDVSRSQSVGAGARLDDADNRIWTVGASCLVFTIEH